MGCGIQNCFHGARLIRIIIKVHTGKVLEDIYISPQFCMSPYTWSFVILGTACIPSYSAAPLQTALYQLEFMFGNFQVWPRSVVAQCNPLTGLVWSQ
jgi:hypothetical protein